MASAEEASSIASDEYEYQYSDYDDDEIMTDDDYNNSGEEINHYVMSSRGSGSKGKRGLSSGAMGKVTRSDKERRKADNNPNAAPVASAMEGGASGVPQDFGSLANANSDIRMLCSSEILPVMKHRIKEVTEVLSIPASAAAVLLREHKWAKERLFETFYNDPDKVQDKCGVRARCSMNYSNGKLKSFPSESKQRNHNNNNYSCDICCEDNFKQSQMLAMPCGHSFCKECWRGFLECMLSNGPACVRTTCPQANCAEIVTEEEVQLAAPDLLPKFELYQLRSFVDMGTGFRWCPGPGCTRVAMQMSMQGSSNGAALLHSSLNNKYLHTIPHYNYNNTAPGLVNVAECDQCTTCFCIRCGEEPHAPASCQELLKWNEKCRNESETANWILANTKPCPKCQSRIEKNQGCNHMSCQQCNYQFCWICLSPWSEHGANTGGYYKCNKFDPSGSTNANDQTDAARAKRELDRYLHYYKRYHAHNEAQKFAKKQLRDTEQGMVLLQETTDNSTWTDVEFLKTATEQLVECRRVLKYTYAFAYYLTDKSKIMQKERFEHHQEMLEKFTENLSELSEKPLAEMDRTDVVNQTRVVDRFMKNVLRYVEDGMEED